MADQHNSNVPAIGNQIANDIPDIKENLEFHKDTFERILETWSDTDNSAAVINSAVGFSDGTYSYDFPTNGVAASSKIMLGTSSTIVWMYLNTAPPGWKVTSTGADTVLAVSGGSDAYAGNGGTSGGTAWSTIETFYSEVDGHLHQWYSEQAAANHDRSYDSNGDVVELSGSEAKLGSARGLNNATLTDTPNVSLYTTSSTGIATLSEARPAASIGKLFQLDTA